CFGKSVLVPYIMDHIVHVKQIRRRGIFAVVQTSIEIQREIEYQTIRGFSKPGKCVGTSFPQPAQTGTVLVIYCNHVVSAGQVVFRSRSTIGVMPSERGSI